MSEMTFGLTYQRPWSRFWSSNSTYNTAISTITAKADVLTTNIADPRSAMLALSSATTGRAIVPVGPGSLVVAQFYGTDAAAETFVGRVWAWRRLEADGTLVQWIPTPVCELSLSLGTKVGIASGFVAATDFYVDAINIGTDGGLLPNQTRTFGETGTATPVQLVVDPIGCEVIEFELTRSGGTAASFNGLWTAVNGG